MRSAETAFKARNFTEATNYLTAALQLNGADPDAWCLRGMSRWWLADFAGAAADYDYAIKLAPKCARYYCNRGQADFSIHHCEAALSDYDKCIDLDSNASIAYFNKGSLLFLCFDDPSGAITNYSHAIELHNDSQPADIYFMRGAAEHQLGKYREAIADYSKALDINASDRWQNATLCREQLTAAKAGMKPQELKSLLSQPQVSGGTSVPRP